MANWTPEEQLAFDIAFALKKVTIPGFRKALKEEDRFAIAEHLKLRSGRLDQNDEPASRYGSDQKHCAPFWFGKLPIED